MFHEVRLDEEIERGATGGPGFNTSVIPLVSGHEKRNINWSEIRGEWDIGYGIQSIDNLENVIGFFYARRGRAFGFRFKDWADYQITGPQSIGTGNGSQTVFDVFKRYSSGGIDFDRRIRKLVNGTVRVFLDGVEQTSGFTVDFNVGQIIFDTAPSNTVDSVAVECEFDVPVRFDTDQLNINVELFDVGSVPSIPIVELRV